MRSAWRRSSPRALTTMRGTMCVVHLALASSLPRFSFVARASRCMWWLLYTSSPLHSLQSPSLFYSLFRRSPLRRRASRACPSPHALLHISPIAPDVHYCGLYLKHPKVALSLLFALLLWIAPERFILCLSPMCHTGWSDAVNCRR